MDKEIKHVLREETNKGNNFDLNKIISIFDSEKTYNEIAERYPELTDDLLHLMPENYSKIQLGQLISAIWSKYLQLQGGDVATQKLLLEKDKEIFHKEKEIQDLKKFNEANNTKKKENSITEEFKVIFESGAVKDFINSKNIVLGTGWIKPMDVRNVAEAAAFGLIEVDQRNRSYLTITDKGRDFFKWLILNTST